MTLWSIFLPLDRHFLLFKGKSSSLVENGVPKVIGISACAFFLQFIFIYLFAGLTKNDSTWAMNGTAVYSSLNLGAFAKPLGVSISRNHELTRFLTSVTTVAEMLMPFLLLLDTKRVSLRLLAVGFFVAMQVGFFATLEVGIFPFAMIAYTLAFLPSCFWEKYVRCNDYSQKEDRKVGKTEKSALRNLIVSMLLLLSTFDVIGSSFKSKYTTLPNWLQETVYSVRVDQRWWMFVVSEWRDFWIDVEAIQGDGGVIDVWSWQRGATDLSFSKERPNDIRDVFSEQPWNNYIHQLKDNALLREWFLFNLCHKYNLANPANKIRELKLHYSYRTILGIDEFTPVSHEVIAEWKCES